MATQIVPQVVQHPVKQNVVQIVLPPASISQEELGHVLEMRRQREALDEQIKEAETAIRSALESGASVEAGIFHAHVKTYERRSVQWKAVCERELGEAFCTRVLAATRPDQFSTLVIGA